MENILTTGTKTLFLGDSFQDYSWDQDFEADFP